MITGLYKLPPLTNDKTKKNVLPLLQSYVSILQMKSEKTLKYWKLLYSVDDRAICNFQ